MNTILRPLFFLPALLLAPLALFATHNRAGEIRVEQIGPLRVRATIITWTRTQSYSADRDTLMIDWGDGGPKEQVVRSNGGGKGVVINDEVKYNEYISTHTYAGPATYCISMTDPNRNAGIINVNPPQSENVPFHISTVYSFQDPQFGGQNSTPKLYQQPIDNACVGKRFKHNPNADDVDHDSLSFHLIVPLQGKGMPVPNYSFPNQIGAGPNNNLSINERTGEIIWDAPQVQGEYNLAFIIVSWRAGVPIDTTIRDMQIFVSNCENNPPVVESPDQFCVVAGETIDFGVKATDPDTGNLVLLTAVGGPLESAYSKATFTAPTGFVLPPVNGVFHWQTVCEHVSNQPYTVVFKAVDSLNKNTPKLADLKTVSIKVVGPPPLDVQAKAQLGVVEISWAKPYACENAAENYFYGFSVWRREGSNPFVPDSCTPGLKGRGYTELIFATKQEKDGRYYFKDEDVERGRTYCYRILAKFARISAGGYPYNLVESLPSEEKCVQLPRDLPLITNATVLQTDAANGQIQVCWSKPVPGDLDTILNHGPYRYQLLRAPGLSGGTFQEVQGASFISATFADANDTCFTEQGLNTLGQPYHYQVAFYVNGESTPLGKTNPASSVFLNIASTDNTNLLSWQENVPWDNYLFTIYRKNDQTGLFDSIGTSVTHAYDDKNLENGKEYCYYVKSQGTYSIAGVIDPIFNLSQESCGIPLDTIPPCIPMLTIKNICNGGNSTEPDPPYENTIIWNNPNVDCPGITGDAVQYRIWYTAMEDGTLALLDVIDGSENTQLIHTIEEGLAGCYAISAVDSVGNESAKSPVECVDNCPEYVLPNAFTPNEDGHNDTFKPFPHWRFIDRIDLQIFNRWGNLVFQTSDPAINWNGRNMSGNELAEGTYLYVCKVYERRVEGVVLRPDVLSGYIELVRGSK